MQQPLPAGPRRAPSPPWRALMWVALSLSPAAVSADAPPRFDQSALSSDNGVAQLTWSDVGAGYEMRLSGPDMPVRTVYRGHLPSAHVSGLPNGAYEVSVRARRDGRAWSAWSEPARIDVHHHPMQLVWLLLTTGAVTFLVTIGTLVVAARRVQA